MSKTAGVFPLYVLFTTDRSGYARSGFEVLIMLLYFATVLVFLVHYFSKNAEAKMGDQKTHFWHIMLFCFEIGFKVSETVIEICSVLGEDVVSSSTVRRWYDKFKLGNLALKPNNAVNVLPL